MKQHKKTIYRCGEREDIKISNYLKTIILNENCNLTFATGNIIQKNFFEKAGYIEYREVSIEEGTNILKEGLPLGFRIGNLYYFFKVLKVENEEELLILTNLRDVTLFLDRLNLEDFLEIYFKDYPRNLLTFYDIRDNINIWLN